MPASLRGPDRLAAYSRAWGQPFFRAKTNEVGVSVACYGEVRPAAPRRLCGRSPRSIARRAARRPRSDARLGRRLARPDGVSGAARRRPGHGGRAARDAAGRPARARPFLRRRRAVAPARLRPGLRAAVLGGAGVADRRARATRGRGVRAWVSRLRRRGGKARRPRTRSPAGRRAPDRRTARRARARGCRRPAPSPLREPLITGRLLARRLDVSTRAGLDLAARLVEAGVLREMTDGRRGGRLA